MSKSFLRFLLVSFVVALLCVAQTSSSTLTGTIYDTSGAVVAGAVVTVTNDATGVAQKQPANSAGLFAFPSIAVGTYTVSVEMSGFKTARRTNVVLQVNTPTALPVTLELGDTREVVKVESAVEQLNTSNATLGNVVSKETVVNLPLNGRNPLNLIVLEPGVTQRSGTTINVNGMRAQAGNVTIDGIEANEASNPTPTNNVFRVNPDNVEEFKVTTSNPTPEEGKNSGLNVSIATRSGTNQIHGSLIEYFRNTAMNTNEFYANAQGQGRADLKSNQYGYDVGGPIQKNKTFFYTAWQGQKVNLSQAIDKAFGSVPRVYSPSALNGVFRYFKADPTNPLVLNGSKILSNSPVLVTSTGALAPGVRNCGSNTDLNCVASYNIFAGDPAGIGADKAVMGVLSKYPLPNNYNVGDGLNQAGYLWNAPSSVRGPRNILRFDHVFNEKNNIFFRAMWAVEQQLKGDLLNGRPSIFPGFPPRGEVYRPAKNYAFSWRHVVSPSTVNELTLGYARFIFLFTYADSNPNFATLPAFTFNNVDVDYINAPHSQRALNTPQFLDNLSVTKGAHQLKFGVNMRFYQQNDQSGTVAGQTVTPAVSLSASLNPAGAAFNLPVVANASSAGIASADNTRLLSAINDLLGIPAQLKQAFLGNLNSNMFLPTRSGNYYSMWDVGERQKQLNFFAQDEWRARRNLTVTYGVRWEINRPPTEVSESPYVPNKPIDGSQGPVTFVKADSWYHRSNLNAFAPRLGVTWSPGSSGRTVVRGGWGIAFDPIPTFQSAAAANTVPGLAYSCTSSTYGPAPTPGCSAVPSNVRLGQGFPQSGSAPALQPSSFLSPPSQLLGVAPNVVVFDPNLKNATVHQWNLTIQRQVPMGFTAQVGYVANRGERLYSQVDANQISSAPILNSFNAMQSNVAAGCKPDGTGCAAGKSGTPVPLVASGIVSSTFVNSSATLTDIQQNAAGNFAGRIEQSTLNAHLRPNQQFSSIMFLSNQADSVYHSLQTTLRRRFAAGLLLNVSYTYGKAIDNMSGDPVGTSYTPTTTTAMDSHNLRLDRGRADFDQRHVMSVTWLYDLPFGKGKKFMHGDSKILDTLLGGWSFQGFNSLMSGEPFSISSGAKTAQYGSNSRAVSTSASLPNDSLHSKTGQIGPVFFDNTSAFAVAPAGSTGMGRNMFQGPKFWDTDMAMSKAFQPIERLKFVLRAEAFNALNHANFRKLGSTSVGSTSILSPNFGAACCQTQSTATSTAIVSNGEAYRVVQFVLRAVF